MTWQNHNGIIQEKNLRKLVKMDGDFMTEKCTRYGSSICWIQEKGENNSDKTRKGMNKDVQMSNRVHKLFQLSFSSRFLT